MKKYNHFHLKMFINNVVVLLGVVLLVVFLRLLQNQASRQQQYVDSMRNLTNIMEILADNEIDGAELVEDYHERNCQTLRDISSALNGRLFENFMRLSKKERAANFSGLIERAGVDYMFLMDTKGSILLAPDAETIGKNLVALGIFTESQLRSVIEGADTVKPISVETSYGSAYFYITPYEGKAVSGYLVLGQLSSVLDVQYSTLTDINNVISDTKTNDGSFFFTVNRKDNTFAYFDNGSSVLTGQDAIGAGLSEKLLQDGGSDTVTIAGRKYYCVSRVYNDTLIITAANATGSLYSNDRKAVFWAATVFIMVVVVTLQYTLFLRRDLTHRDGGMELEHIFDTKLTLNKTVARKVLPVTVLGLLLIFGATYYTQTLMNISRALNTAESALTEVDKQFKANEESRAIIKNYYAKHYLSKAKLLAFLLEEDPSALNVKTTKVHTRYAEDGTKNAILDDEGNPLHSVANSARLKEFCADNSISGVHVFDEQGRTIAASGEDWYFTLSMDPEADSYALRTVLDGKQESLLLDKMDDSTCGHKVYAAAAFTYYTTLDADGNTLYVSDGDYLKQEQGLWGGNPITAHQSMLMISLDEEKVYDILYSTDVDYLLERSSIADGGFLIAFDNSPEHVLVYSPTERDIGKTAEQLGVDSAVFSGDYNGFQTVDGVKLFECYRYYDGYAVAICIPAENLFNSRLPISLITVAVSFLVLVIIQALFLFSTEEEEQAYVEYERDRMKQEEEAAHVTVALPNGEHRYSTAALSRWNREKLSWNQKTPEQKLLVMMRVCGVIVMVYLVISLIWRNEIFSDGSIIHYIISGGWERGLNIFALSRCVLLFMTVNIFTAILNAIIRMITSIFGVRTETIGHLLMSVIKYGSALGAIFYSLYLIGFDSMALLTSAGILSVVVGLGAQSLISDIIAGIFIVFEGDFRVGDIVTIGDTRGTVLDIGIRTTKVADSLENIKIYNNSTISGVLNMTKKSSVATCILPIAYGESVERVESILQQEFPAIREKYPAILDGPFYRGVKELGASSVDLLITAKCTEAKRMQLARDLNREMFLICAKYDIDIPFSQITVSYLDKDYEKRKATWAEELHAKQFEKEQKEHTSPDIPEEPVK